MGFIFDSLSIFPYICKKLLMKLIKSIYQDSKGNEWVIEKCTLPKMKRGEYIFYAAECTSLNKSLRNEKKGLVIKEIEAI